MSHKNSESTGSRDSVFDSVKNIAQDETELHGVWTSQLVRRKEVVDSDYNRAHPLEAVFGQNFTRSH